MAVPFIYANIAVEFSQLHQLLSKFQQPSLCAVTNIIHLQKLPVSYRGPNRGHAHILRKYFRLHIFHATIFPPHGSAPQRGQGLLILEVSRSHTTTHQSR